MGHATHFLQRLDRVSDGQVELALTLYRDEALLREVLSRASLPDGAEGLAISLEHPDDGPFVVVTREGRFVTCLAAGMRARDLPLVTREQLDNAAARVERMRERLARVQQLRESGAESEASLRFRRMQQQGPRFAREDAQTLLQVMPLMEPVCCHVLRDLVLGMERNRDHIGRFRIDDPRRLSSTQKDALLAFGDVAWSIANLIALVTPQAVDRTLKADDGRSATHALAYLTSTCGTIAHHTRALWFIARGGKPALSDAKSLRCTAGLQTIIWRELAVGAIGLYSKKLRAEACKALSFDPLDAPATPENVIASTSGLFGRLMRSVIEKPDLDTDEDFLAVARTFVAGMVGGHEDRPPPQEEIDAVPDDIARAAWLTTAISLHDAKSLSVLTIVPLGLRWIVSASPEELFLPTAWARRVLPPRGLEDVLFWLRPMLDAYGLSSQRKRPVTRDRPKAGRNDPCPCGSGKKHKRCCG